ncbi:MAG: redoxin family protein [Phycisphaerales bacterium]
MLLHCVSCAGIRTLLLAAGCAVVSTTTTLANGVDDTPAGPFRESAQSGVDPRPFHIGERVPNVELTTLSGRATTLHKEARDAAVLVVALRDTGCPLCQKYLPRLEEIRDRYRDHAVQLLFVNVSAVNSVEDVVADANRLGGEGWYVHSVQGELAGALGAQRTTDVFVLDKAATLVYRGAIDDQHGIGFSTDSPRNTFLIDAIDATLQGERPAVEVTFAPGCELEADVAQEEAPDFDSHITYHNRISRIVQRNCTDCHRAEGAAPFPLETYEHVFGRRKMIGYAIANDIMPPWHAGPGSRAFANDRSLSQRDRSAVEAWIAAGGPAGEAADAPLPRNYTTAWQIGEPDAVVTIDTPLSVPAQGTVRYRYHYVKTDFPEDRWISRMEIRPTHPEVVHHILVFLEDPQQEGEDRRDVQRRWQGGLQGYFAGLVPGQATTVYPEGMAKRLPAGAWLKFQIHYTPNGTAVEDQPELGFVFADGPPARELRTASAMTTEFQIPPDAANYKVVAEQRFSRDVMLYSFAPHMHVRGKAFRYELIKPDGDVELLLDIPGYDFNWQTRYKLRDPIAVAAGSRLRATAWYDNSENNPANPDHTQRVRFGEQTWEEMMIGYFEYWRVVE